MDDFYDGEAFWEKKLAEIQALMEGRFSLRIISTLQCVKCGARFTQDMNHAALYHSMTCKLPSKLPEEKDELLTRAHPINKQHKNYPWIILDYGMEPNVIICEHCHTAERLPDNKFDYDHAVRDFIEKHKICKEEIEPDENP